MGGMSYAAATACAVAATCGFHPTLKGAKFVSLSLNEEEELTCPPMADNEAGPEELVLATEHSLSPIHRAALFALAFNPGAYPSDLAKTCDVSSMEMVDIVNELIAWGLVARAEGPSAA